MKHKIILNTFYPTYVEAKTNRKRLEFYKMYRYKNNLDNF